MTDRELIEKCRFDLSICGEITSPYANEIFNRFIEMYNEKIEKESCEKKI
jgi:hypothetical protein